jgi:putative hydrolase of HD superfamily
MAKDAVKKEESESVDPSGLPIADERLQQQMAFLIEIDKLKSIVRRSPLAYGSRLENSAEHSWHLAMAAMILSEYAAETGLDPLHAVKLLIVHDLVEIDAGDTYCYDDKGREDQKQREQIAAERIFGLLPIDQKEMLNGLWQEFEARRTIEARFAHAADRLMPLLHNYLDEGRSWKENGIRRHQVEARMASIRPGSESLHLVATAIIDDAVRKGFLAE